MDLPSSLAHRKFSFWRSAKNQFALAAGFILFVSISYAMLRFVVGSNAGRQDSVIYAAIIEEYIENFDTYLLIDAYAEPDVEPDLTQDVSFEDEMIEYLISEDIDIELIINEF